MKILEIGSRFNTTEKINYLSAINLLDYDMVIIDLNTLTVNSKHHNVGNYIKRRKDLENFIHYKNLPLIYFVPYPELKEVIDNRAISKKTFDFFAPIPELFIKPQQGKTTELVGSGILQEFVKEYKEYIVYNYSFENKPGNVFLQVPYTKNPVGFWNQDCVFLPDLSLPNDIEKDFLTELYESVKSLRKGNEDVELPQWAECYLVPEEKSLKEEISNIEQQIFELSVKSASKKEDYSSLIKHKSLFTSTGTNLEKKVEGIFAEIGFEILEAEDNRDDLIMKFNEDIIVVEIKGVTGSSAEKHAAQLEKWAANYYEKANVKPKPILLVNAYKDTPLSERNETTSPTFPHQMLKYSTSREHCLLTTLQLLGLYYHIKANSSDRDSIISKLMSTVGKFDMFEDWNDFITFQS